MRIGIDARILQEPLRGQGQYAHYLIKHLMRRAPENSYTLFFNGLRQGRGILQDPPSCLRQVWCHLPGTFLKPCWEWMHWPPVESFIGEVDVFHNPFNYNFVHHTPLPSRAPRVVTFNGMADPSTIWDHYDGRKINRWFDEISKTSAKIICVSDMVKENLLRRVKVSEDVLRIVHYGVGEEFKPLHDPERIIAVRARYGIKGNRFVLYAGAAEKNKNLSGLLDAFAMYREQNRSDDTCLVLAGCIDAAYQRIMQEANAKNLSGCVLFPGFIGHEDLPLMYCAAQAFVLPTFLEWFGIPILESLACGVPTIASKHCGALEAVGDAVVTFDPFKPEEIAQALHRVLHDTDLRATLVEKGIQRVRACSWDVTAEKTLAVYKEACAR